MLYYINFYLLSRYFFHICFLLLRGQLLYPLKPDIVINMKRSIHLIRHGITEANQRNMFYGRSNFPLADEGVSSIRALLAEGVYPKPETAKYYTSALSRTEQTLSLIYGEVPHVRLGEFNEIFFGSYEKKTHEELKGDPDYTTWVNDKSGLLAPHGGENFTQFAERVLGGFRAVLESEAEHSVVVCHGGVICVIMCHYFAVDGDIFKWEWVPKPGHGYTVIFDGSQPIGNTPF